MVSKRKIPSPHRESKPDHPARSQSLCRLSYPGSTREKEECKFSLIKGTCYRKNSYAPLNYAVMLQLKPVKTSMTHQLASSHPKKDPEVSVPENQ
jgi:hypothetical protein